jgi:tetratricopeptide (TPR) repeat protein
MRRTIILFSCFLILTPALSARLHGQNQQLLDSLLYVLETAQDNHQKVGALIKISSEYARHDLFTSLRYAERSLELARQSHDNELISSAKANMGYVCFNHGLLELAARSYFSYKELQQQIGNEEGVLKASVNIAAIKLMMEDFAGTRDDLLEILHSIESGRLKSPKDSLPPDVLTTIYNNLGVVYENLGETPEAIEYYLRGVSLARRLPGQQEMLGRLLNNLGKLYAEQGRHTEGLAILDEALQLRLQINDSHGQASSYRNLAIFHFGRGNYPQVLEYGYKGLALAERVGSLQLLSNFSRHLYEYYDTRNMPDSALKYLKLFKGYYDQHKTEETHKEITRLEVTAGFQERELIRALEQRRKEQRFYYVGGLMFSIMVIMGLIAFLGQSRAKRLRLLNANMRLESKNFHLEKMNLERELEVKNKELTTNVMYQISKNELIREIIEKLRQLSREIKPEQQERFLAIVKDMEKTREETAWEEFEMRFHNVHNEFYDKLLKEFPDLSLNERRLCSFLRLNMTTKEISSITGQSPKSIDMARTRLRKKLNLTNSETALSDFLASV